MKFHFSRHRLRGRERTLERFFEILPGALSWFILIAASILAFKQPLIAAVCIIAFYLYWLLRLFYMNLFLMFSYFRLSVEKNTEWIKLINGVGSPNSLLHTLRQSDRTLSFRDKVARFVHVNELKHLSKDGDKALLPTDIHQLVIIPVARETPDIIEPGIKSLINGKFPLKRIIVFIALEERADEEVKRGIAQIQERYEAKFLKFAVSVHPSDLPGEAKVKGANATFAAREAEAYLTKNKIPYENVICSCFDADTVVSEDYLSCLTYHYLITPNRTRASYQPIPVYNNNIWEAPGFARVLDIGSSFFQLIEATNPEKLVTFSSHSMSFKALVETDYWPVDIISDDSAIYWKAFIHFNGDYRVIPMYVTLSMDVTEAETWWRTVVNVYKQKRRWAWGVENFPIVMRAFLKAGKIPVLTKIKLGLKLLEGHIAWTTWPFLLSIIGWLPGIFATRYYTHSMFYYTEPRITGTIFTLASFGLITCIILSILLLPKRKVKHNILRRIGHAFEWLLVPPISVFLSALPALDAQTRLMLGKYMEFWVTVKKRKK